MLTHLVNDATILIRDMAGDAAQKAATHVNPSEDQLGQIDHAAEDNTWHEVPDLSRKNIKSQLKSQYAKQRPFGRSDVDDTVGDATQAAHPTGERDPANLAEQDREGVDSQSGAVAGAQTLTDRATANVPDETQEKTKESTRKFNAQAKDYLGRKMPKERREQTIWRLKKMVVEIQGHSDCMEIHSCLSNMNTDNMFNRSASH